METATASAGGPAAGGAKVPGLMNPGKTWAFAVVKNLPWNFPDHEEGLRLHLPTQGVRVWSLARELRSHMPLGQKATTENRM